MDFEGVLIQKHQCGISVARCNYITACAQLCDPVDHSSLVLPSLHSIMACSGRYATKSFFEGVSIQKHYLGIS